MADEPVNVVLSADVGQYQQGVTSAEASTNQLITTIEKLGTATDNAFKRSGSAMKIGGAGLAASMVAAGVAAGRLDSQMAQLQGSTQLVSKSQIEGERRIKDYSKAITGLRSDFGTTSSEAVGLVTQLNKLSAKSKDIEELAKTYTRLGAVTSESVSGLASEMTTLQRQMNTTGTAQTAKFSATLAELSQNAGVSATSVLQFANAIAPVARVAGMTTKEVLGFSTAFNKAGADGFGATTAFNKMVTDITKSIQYGSPELNAYANLIGVSADAFKKMDRADAVIKIFEAINKQGPDAIKTLNRFGLDGVRTYRSIQTVASQSGGLANAVEAAVTGGDTDKMKKAGETTFSGLNDEMRKTGESAKMITEAFGQGVLPVLEKAARGVNAMLRPLNEFLQSLGKVPGGTALLAGLGTAVAGFAVSNAMKIAGIGAVMGPGMTIATGWRAGGPASRMSPATRTALASHEAWSRGESAPGNWGQHRVFGFGQSARTAWDARSTLSPMEQAARVGHRLDRLGGAVVGFAGQMLRAPMDPLQLRTMRNVFDRDQALTMFKDPSAARSLGIDQTRSFISDKTILAKEKLAPLIDKTKTFGQAHIPIGLMTAGKTALDATKPSIDKLTPAIDKAGESFKKISASTLNASTATVKQSTAVNTAINSQTKYSGTVSALTGETVKLAQSTTQAAARLTMIGAGAARDIGAVAGASFANKFKAGIPGALEKTGNFLGGPLGIAMVGGMAAMSMYGRRKQANADIQETLASDENSSFTSQYSASVGDATTALYNFTEALKSSSSTLKDTTWSSKVTAADLERMKVDGGGPFVSKQMEDLKGRMSWITSALPPRPSVSGMPGRGEIDNPWQREGSPWATQATQPQERNAGVKNVALQIATATMAGQPSNAALESLKGDMLRLFGTDEEGVSTVESLLSQAQTNARTNNIDLKALYGNTAATQGFNMLKFWQHIGPSTATLDSAKASGNAISDLAGAASKSDAAQVQLASFNAAQKSIADMGNVRSGAETEGIAVQFASGLGVKNDDKKSLEAISKALALNDTIKAQENLMASDSEAGVAFRSAIRSLGPNADRNSMAMPLRNIMLNSGWDTKIDAGTLALLQGNSLDGGRSGKMGQLGMGIFGQAPLSTEVGRDVNRFLSSEGDANAMWTAMNSVAKEAINVAGSFSGAITEIDRMKTASNDTTAAFYQLMSAAQQQVRQRQAESVRNAPAWVQAGEARKNYLASRDSWMAAPNQESGQMMEQDRQAWGAERDKAFDYFKQIAYAKREYDIQVEQSQYDFDIQRDRSEYEFNLSRTRAWFDFNLQRERAEYQYHLQRQYQQEDYNRSREYAFYDFDKSRRRAEDDYQHQILIQTKQTAQSMTNIYERITVQRTWSAENLMQNMLDQQEKLAEAQANLQKLRGAGLSGDAIQMMGLNDPNNAQQLARLADDAINNPELIERFNQAVRDRTIAATAIVQDESSLQWQEMQRAFNLQMDRGEEDFLLGMDRQAVQYGIGLSRMQDAFELQMSQGMEDMNRMMLRGSEDFFRQHDNMRTDYELAMQRTAEGFQRQYEVITGDFTDFALMGLDILQGASRDQMLATLGNLGYTRTDLLKISQGLAQDVYDLLNSLGITPNIRIAGENAAGGVVRGWADGGEVEGSSPHPKADNIPAWLTAGEYIQPVESVDYYGKGFHEAVRKKQFPKELVEGYAEGGLVTFGKYLQSKDFRVGEHPLFGGVRGRHLSTAKGGLHYVGGAIDVNADHHIGGEMAAIDKLVATQIARRLYGLRTLWRTSGHYDHAHFDTGSGPDRGNFAGTTSGGLSGVFDMEAEIKTMVNNLRGVNNWGDLFGKNPLPILRQYGKPWLAEKIVDMIMSRIDPYNDDTSATSDSVSALKQMVKTKAANRGWSGSNWNAVDWIVQHESSWNPRAQNPTSTAYGLFQFLDSTWKTVGGTKTSDPNKQADYGLQYIAQRYKTPLGAKAFWERNNWYGDGAMFSGPTKIGVGERGPEAVIPLNQRGVEFLHQVMKKNSVEAKRAMVNVNGIPQRVSSANYYQQIDAGNHFTGPITVQANDPDELIRKLARKKKIDAMKGRATSDVLSRV